MRCEGKNCTKQNVWGFQRTRYTHQWLCDDCWGHKYGEHTCRKCEEGCYEEDMEDNTETYLCGRCQREEAA